MCRFIETIKIVDGSAQNIEKHSLRMNDTRRHFFGDISELDLSNYVSNIPNIPSNKILRCTITYHKEIIDYKIIDYKIPVIKSLKIIPDNAIDYSFKYADRSKLNALYEKRENCDDIIILKNGLFTDSLFANLVFFDGNKYFTPAYPLLKGTKRSYLIEKGILTEEEIGIKDLTSFKHCGIINAMLDPEDCKIEIKNIYT